MQHWISLIVAIGALSTADGLESTGWARDRRNHAGLDGPDTVNMTLVPSVTNVAVYGEWEWAKGVPPCADNEINLRLPDADDDDDYDDLTDRSMSEWQFVSLQSTVELSGFSFGANPNDGLVLGVIFDGGGIYLNDPDDEHVPCLTAAPTLGPTMLPSTDPTSSPAGVPTTSPTQTANPADVGERAGGADGSDVESGSVAAIVIALLVVLAVMAVLLRRRQRELSANGADEPDVEDLAPSAAPASKLETITAGIAVPATSPAYLLAPRFSDHDAIYDTAERPSLTATVQGDYNAAASGKSSTEENNYSMPSAPEDMPSAPLDVHNTYYLASASGPDSSDDYDICGEVLGSLGTVAHGSPGTLLRRSTFADDGVLTTMESTGVGRSTSYGDAQAAVIEDEPADPLEPLFDGDTDTGATSEPALKLEESEGSAFSIGRFSKQISRSGGKTLVTPNIMAPTKRRTMMELCPEDGIIQFLGAVTDTDGDDGAAGHAPADAPAYIYVPAYDPDDGPIKRRKSRLSLV